MITKLDIIWSAKIGAKLQNLFITANYLRNNAPTSLIIGIFIPQKQESKYNNRDNMSKQKITWLQVLQGWSMLLVVIGHITLTGIFKNPGTPISAAIERIIYGFHMPLFMFTSGFLFYLTKISRNINYGAVVVDKLKRLGTPFLFFTFFTFGVKYLFAPFMKRPVELSVKQVIDSFLYPGHNPLSEMWFIATLFIIMLTYPILRKAITTGWDIAMLLIVGAALNLFFPTDIELLCLSDVAYMFLFFCLGVLCCQFNIQRYFNSLGSLAITLFLFIWANLTFSCPNPLLNLIGIAFSLSLCLNVTKVAPRLFSSFRDYTFQIFLLGIFPQIAVRLLYGKLPQSEPLYWGLYLLSILLGIYIPVVVAKIIERINSPILRRCFGL